MKVAMVGCTHGNLDRIYDRIAEIENERNIQIDLLLCPGDFQAVRNAADLSTLVCPHYHRKYGDFQQYYNGTKKATKPTIFIGGNHEPANFILEMPLGGIVAPNIYFLGYAGVIIYNGLKIGGISGIYHQNYYHQKRSEFPPYNSFNELRNSYKTKLEDVQKLCRLKSGIHVFMSHDWPKNITKFGDSNALVEKVPRLKEDIINHNIGGLSGEVLLNTLKPNFYLAAHMHVRFDAKVNHSQENQSTTFLALDKVKNNREWIDVISFDNIDVPSENTSDEPILELDAEWLTILYTQSRDSNRSSNVTNEEIHYVQQLLIENNISTKIRLQSDFIPRVDTNQQAVHPFPTSIECAEEWPFWDSKNLQLFKALKIKVPPLYKEM